MQCPSCEYTGFPPNFTCKFCPECGSALPPAQHIPSKIEHGDHGVETAQLQQTASSTRDNGDLGLDNRSIQGESHQQKVLTREREQRDPSTGQHFGLVQQPNKNDGSITVRQDEMPNSSADIEEQDLTSQELSDDDIKKNSDDQRQHSDPESIITERNTTESAAGTTMTPAELALKTQDRLVPDSEMKDSKKHAQGKKGRGWTFFKNRGTPQEETLDDQIGEKTSTTRPPQSLQQVKLEAGVTVVFHVLLASDFNMTEGSFFLRAHGVELGDFEENCVEMTTVEIVEGQDKDKMTLFRGQLTISLDRARKGTSYKYVIVKEGNVHWEQLPEFPPKCDKDSIVNRFLKIPDKHIEQGASWNQFDGVAYVYVDKDMSSRMWGCPSKDKLVEYRIKALLCFLPKWSGFFVSETAENMDATEALVKLDNVVNCLQNVWIEEPDGHRQRQPIFFDVQKTLSDILKPKMKNNRAILAKCKVGSAEHVSAVLSSLAITVLVKKYSIKLKSEEVKLLLSCLSLEADPTEKRCSAYEAVLDEFSTELRDSAASAIESLCDQLMKDAWTSSPEWILAVPLLHFFRGDSKPFEEPDIQGWPETPAWWGAQRLNIRKFRRSVQQYFSDVWSRLVSAFDVDRLLKRTFLYAFPVWLLPGIISTRMFYISDLCVALVEFFPSGFGNKKEKSSFEQCLQAMIRMSDNGNETNSSKTKDREFTVAASLKLAQVCLDNLSFRDDTDLICLAIKLLFSSIQQWQNGRVDGETDDKVNKTDASLKEDVVRKISRKLVSKLRQVPESNMLDNHQSDTLPVEMKLWSAFLKVSDGTHGFEEYRSYLTEQFVNRARRMKDTCLDIFCELNLEEYDRAVGESITKLAFEAVDKIVESRQGADVDHVFMSLRTSSLRDDTGAEKRRQLLSVLLTKSWLKASQYQNRSGLHPYTVEFLLTWSPMVGYFHLLGNELGTGSILTAEGQETLSAAESVLMALVKSISNASVTLEILALLKKYREKFLELLEVLNLEANTREQSEINLVERYQEIEEFEAIKVKMVSFVNMCDLIQPVDTASVKDKLRREVYRYQMRDLCKRKSDKQIEVKFFELPSVVKDVISPLHDIQESLTFQDIWTHCGKKAQTARRNGEAKIPHLSISEVVEHVWKPAFQDWKQHSASVMNGMISLGNVDKLFDSYKKRKKDLERELLCMFKLSQGQPEFNTDELRRIAAERVTQIQRYQQLYQYAGAADTIWQFKEAMGFTGNFKVIGNLLNQLSMDFKQMPLNSIGGEFYGAVRALEFFDVEKVNCFKAMVKCKRLVDWLRTTIKSTQELKVLVDLALISAGESDMETDRISSLHTSCLGFAPLIFDLRESEEQKVNFDDLVKACDPVWKAVETDHSLPQKLYDTSRHLEWLKRIQKSHGSVSMTSLIQARTINTCGVYIVGHMDTKSCSPTEQGRRLSFNDVIQLTVPTKDGSEEVQSKTFSVDELKDLQSKLMLIAGKAEKGRKDEVEQFVKNLEGVMRLATAYINLSESGFVHHLHWNKQFHCSKDQSEGKSIANELAAESVSMENCYSNWKKKVSDERKKYWELNFFTTQQLMLLRKEIATVCHGEDLLVSNLQVLTLLESVRPNLDTKMLKSAIKTIAHQRKEEDEDNEAGIRQYLTLSQLGHILQKLRVKGKRTTPRTFPAFLHRGRPNLMLVPKGEVLLTVLALYMHDKKQPLPSHEQVLICTPETTTEEIELLWRRATGDLEGRFYCLVYADLLDFSVSKQAVDMLGVVTQGLAGKTGEQYGLVVICSSENEECANIVGALDQYRVAAPPCPSPDNLKSYLKDQFRSPPPQYGYINSSKIPWTAAGSLDPEKCCVRVISSKRGGLGKSLFVRRLTDRLPLLNNDMVLANSTAALHVTVPLHGNSADSSMLVDSLLPHTVRANLPLSRVFHLDVSPSIRRGLDSLLFNLLVLGCLCDKMGRVWRRRSTDLYVFEITTSPLPMGFTRGEEAEIQRGHSGRSIMCKRPFYDLLPTIECDTPEIVQCRLVENQGIQTDRSANPPSARQNILRKSNEVHPNNFNPLLDVEEFRNKPFQRVYQYLKRLSNGESLDNFTFLPEEIDEDRRTCLMLLLRNCGTPDPSWSEICHFVNFLNSQLRDCEQSVFCNPELMRDALEGFRSFVARFMIQMSRDFATPSLMDENTFTDDNTEFERRDLEQFRLRRSWEKSPHPYLFFNQDHITMTFLGFDINSTGDLIDLRTGRVLEKGLMPEQLRTGLEAQGVDLTTNTENLEKAKKIDQLCSVMGVQWLHDPDQAYELTTDNVKKILAIHMRFRCNIPVIVMGETGCGKTRLIRYMCGLQAGPDGPRNMLLMKVHGGTTYEDVKLKVKQVEEMARQNQGKNIDTVLFFDEANTTDALSMIKEVMVDRRINGKPIGQGLERLQFIAACNPYRRHTDDMIHKLESAGLGYHVKTDDSEDRLDHIPLRHLVYRVHALPGSMRPLIWDFGQLKPDIERLYTNQIVSRYILHERQIPGDASMVQGVADVLVASQKYMRDQSDECSFVSLRDVERAMQVMIWFYNHLETLGRLMNKVLTKQRREEGRDADEDCENNEMITSITRALVLAIGVCYHAKLQERREEYRTVVARSFKTPCFLPGGQKQILREISNCQTAVLQELKLGQNIARNTALSENVFMMVVCIELRIPLFVVGKPGSSKSLAKTVVADNMQGDAARSELFKTFKQVHMASYQCSPLSTPEGVEATFRQCRKLQEGKNPEKFVSVVVLDEVGLAEDSPLMPLKTLHPLLEDGVASADDVIETDEKPQHVAFIGISNWALDPAKMNRGIMLLRGVPDVGELVDSALGICSTDKQVKHLIQPLISPLADGYAELYKEQKNFATLKKCGKEEFFGLRDFYSLIKMVYSIAAKSGERPLWHQLEHAIKRNFGGLVEGEPVEILKRYCQPTDEETSTETSTTLRLIEASLRREDVADRTNFSENRYLLLLTENYAALTIMQQHLLKTADDAVVIFGSSFPNDQEYTQICRNINRIKVCMETGRTVILLNLESLYESLYDALNQYYVYFGGQKYVDLGLGTHRVKCRVHDDFRLIVIAEKDVVYNKFPIPLINRLEKHYLVTSTSLTPVQMKLVDELRTWVSDFSKVIKEGKRKRDFSVGDTFVGYHDDTIPSIVMQVWNDMEEDDDLRDETTEDTWEMIVLQRCQRTLLEMAAPDAIARLPATLLEGRARDIWNIYFHEQQHSSLSAFMGHVLNLEDAHIEKKRQDGLLIQITTHSRLLSNNDLADICNRTGFRRSTVDFMTLQQFQTEEQFRGSIRALFERLGGDCPGTLLVQCDSGDDNSNLIAVARHILLEERTNAPEMLNLRSIEAVHVVLVIQLPRMVGGCRNIVGFQGRKWISTHIDELRPPDRYFPSIEKLIDRPISELFRSGTRKQKEGDEITEALAVKLLRNCVQAAACRVDNDADSTQRSTQRIELLLDLLHDDSQGAGETFASVVTERMLYLLKEREALAYNAQEWLHTEALSETGVREWGTFRKAIWKTVYSAVVPILAEIIALADRDSNLDLMRSDDAWISKLWLKIMADPNISELSYRKMISPVTNSVRERVQVLGSGAGGHRFQCKFPFSFLVKQRMEQLLNEAYGISAQSSATLVESLRGLIDNSEIGSLLRELRNQPYSTLAYLMDFVHMVYEPSSDIDYELVYEAILSSVRELRTLEKEEDIDVIDIPLVHVAHSRVQFRLRCFAKLVQAHPDLMPRLKAMKRKKETEVFLDVIALQVCLEALSPSRKILLKPESRRAWCDKMLSIRPVVEDMMRKERLGPVTEMCSNYGQKSTVMLDRCRCMWQREGAIRLFVEHVTLSNEQDDNTNTETVVRLWKALGDETDFSTLRSLQVIEKFLISFSEHFRKRWLFFRHPFNWIRLKMNRPTAVRAHEKTTSELRSHCNAFFMDLVSIFCFGDSSKDLEQDAISLLMRYVVSSQSIQTKDFSPFPDYGIDPTPVVRSFLLQQLARSSTKLVKDQMDVFLQEAQRLNPEPQHIKEVCILYVQCMEDILISRYQSKVADSTLTVKLKHAKKICDEAVKALTGNDEGSSEINANALEGVAKGRYVLFLVAGTLYNWFIEGDSRYKDFDVQREAERLLGSAKKLCMKGSSTTPQLYLLKQIDRRYGFDRVRTMGGYKELEWILPPVARQQEDDVIQDRFIVHEKYYRALREGLAKTVISGNIQDIVTAITETEEQGGNIDILLLLALYREITLANASLVQSPKFVEVKEKLDDFIKNGGCVSSTPQPFARQLLENSQGGQLRELQVFRGKSSQEHTLAEIVIHTSAALQCVRSGSLAQPLCTLMTDPSTMKNSFLPTMPEDSFLECINVIAETMKGTRWVGEWYECGNCRHPYFIGECTKPMQKGTCPDCGKVMGGEEHKFLGEYKVSDRKDRTKTGHTLGDPGSRPACAEPQRRMSPIVCGLLRIIMHSAMVMGACRNAPETAQLITPPCQAQSVAQFLWEHLQQDLDVLGRALGRSVDDAALTVHLVLQQMISLNGGQTANAHDMLLQNRDSRRNWEADFCSVIIVPVITHLDQNLQRASRLLMEDERFGSDPLVRQLYEFDEHIEDLTQGVKPMSKALWKYRRQITVEHLGNSFQQQVHPGGEQQCNVLNAFLTQEHKLRFVQFLPDLVRLQRLLMDRFHRRIDRKDAEGYTIRKFLQDLPRGSVKDEYTKLFQSFKTAWNSCRSFLGDQGRLRVPQDLCNTTMDNDCPIAMLLPGTTGMGVCSTSLTFFLVNTHNEFLGAYRNATNQECALDRVSSASVTMSHLIAYDPERDLLPLILAHCNYSLEVGQETLVHYDWTALERQLIDRFLRGRPFVEFKDERFAFSRDTRDDAVFASLNEKIPQEPISRFIEGQIIVEFRSSLSDVCDVLSSLDIAIGFLASSGGQTKTTLKWYLHEVLKLPKEHGLKSPTAEQHCNLSHTLALWRLMALEKAKIKSRNNQEPFEQMPDAFKERLSSSHLAHLNRVLRKIDMDLFLPQLLELILLNVEKDGENISTMSFAEYLELCLADKGLEQIPGTENIPDDIQMKHVKAVWNSAVQLCDDFHQERLAATA